MNLKRKKETTNSDKIFQECPVRLNNPRLYKGLNTPYINRKSGVRYPEPAPPFSSVPTILEIINKPDPDVRLQANTLF